MVIDFLPCPEPAMADTEKLTINLSPVDLGRIELLVGQGFYANRAEFIRVAVHTQLEKHAEVVKEAAVRESLVIGAMTFGRRALEMHKQQGEKMRIRVVGFVSIADDVTPELARETIESVTVHGVFKAPAAVKDALADRTH